MQNAAAQQPVRIQSIDVVRGLVMIIMALDHTREYFHVLGISGNPTDLSTTTPALFFTRWITHFCAPVFVFLSGASAYLSAQKRTPGQMQSFLIKRGAWLLLVEVVVITLGLTFNPFYNFIFLQVIWAIGWSMIIVALLIKLPVRVIAIIGFLIVAGHNITDHIPLPKTGATAVVLNVLVTAVGSVYPLGEGRLIGVFYAILPWTGVILLGYSFAKIYTRQVAGAARTRKVMIIGVIVTALFIILRTVNIYGDPAPWSHQRTGIYTLLSFLNTTKYPCSLQYVCMTVGPAIMLLAASEGVRNKFTGVLQTYGRVPFFYYVLHFYLLHTILVVLFFASGYTTKDIVSPNIPFWFRPPQFGYSLGVVYLIWLSAVATLYLPCKWFYRYKQAHRQWWLSYL